MLRCKPAERTQPALRLLTVGVCVMLGAFFRVVLRMHLMAVRHVRVMTGYLVISGVMVIRGRAMVRRAVLVMFCCLTMMLSALFRHGNPF
jgi:hypothetical protein